MKLIITIFFILLFGFFINKTSTPKKTDLLVCLGGDNYKKRLDKTLELYNEGYLTGDYIIFTGIKNLEYKAKQILKNHSIIVTNNLENTMEEIIGIKNFILKNNIHSIIIVTDIPHSYRVKFFWDNFGIHLENVTLTVVGTDLNGSWKEEIYLKNLSSIKYTFLESIKIVYNVILYTLFRKQSFESLEIKENIF